MSELLKRTKALIEDPKRWCRLASAREADGGVAYLESDDACQWCVTGAYQKIRYCSGLDLDEDRAGMSDLYLERAAHSVIERAGRLQHYYNCGYYQGNALVYVNDFMGHAAVMEMLDLAIDQFEKHAAAVSENDHGATDEGVSMEALNAAIDHLIN